MERMESRVGEVMRPELGGRSVKAAAIGVAM